MVGSFRLIAAAGASLTGFDYSLVYPGLGVEAVRLAPPESRGVAMGAYTACLDIALGVSGPVLGLVASGAGLSMVFDVHLGILLEAGSKMWRKLSTHRKGRTKTWYLCLNDT